MSCMWACAFLWTSECFCVYVRCACVFLCLCMRVHTLCNVYSTRARVRYGTVTNLYVSNKISRQTCQLPLDWCDVSNSSLLLFRQWITVSVYYGFFCSQNSELFVSTSFCIIYYYHHPFFVWSAIVFFYSILSYLHELKFSVLLSIFPSFVSHISIAPCVCRSATNRTRKRK